MTRIVEESEGGEAGGRFPSKRSILWNDVVCQCANDDYVSKPFPSLIVLAFVAIENAIEQSLVVPYYLLCNVRASRWNSQGNINTL